MQVIRFEKMAGDNRVWGVDFYSFPEAIAGDVLTGSTIVADAGINVFSPVVNSFKVLFQVTGGSAGTTYRLLVKSTWQSGAEIDQAVDVAVLNPATGN